MHWQTECFLSLQRKLHLRRTLYTVHLYSSQLTCALQKAINAIVVPVLVTLLDSPDGLANENYLSI